MNRYTAPMRDMKFALFDVLEGKAKYGEAGTVRLPVELVLPMMR